MSEELNQKLQWDSISVPIENLMTRYEKSSLFRMPEGTEFAGQVFYIPNALYKESCEMIDNAKISCYAISFNKNSTFRIKNKQGIETIITSEQFAKALNNSVLNTLKTKKTLYQNKFLYENNTPLLLKQRKQFVCMELTWNEQKEKFDKMIVNAVTGGNAQVDNPATWNDFDTACAAARKGNVKGRRIDGIGYVLTGDESVIGIDLDLDLNKQLTAQGKEILDKLENKTYIEHSVSGAIHIFGIGEKQGNRCKGKDDNSLEIYGSKGGNRCIMLTGNLYKNKFVDLKNIQAEVDNIYNNYFNVLQTERKILQTTSSMSQNEILEKINASESADKFKDLMNGNITKYIGVDGKPDYTRADLALCSIVGFFTQDRSIIDGIYRQSQLYSARKENSRTGKLESRADKWDSRRAGGTYGQQTIDLALKNLINTYTKKEIDYVETQPMRIYKSTDKAVLVKIEDAQAKEGKRFEWLPKYLVQTDKTESQVISVEKNMLKEKNLPASININKNTKK